MSMPSGAERRTIDRFATLAALRGVPGVHDAVVTERVGPDGRTMLFGYVAGLPTTTTEGIRQHLTTRLPAALVPERVMVLDALPLDHDGDYDVDALPDPPADLVRPSTYMAPRTPLEERLAALVTELVDVPRVGVHDSFFALGGSSIQATRLTRRMREEFGVEPRLQEVFAAPTVDGLSQLVVRTLGERATTRKVRTKRWRRWAGAPEQAWRTVHGKLPMTLRRRVWPGVPCGLRSSDEYKAMFDLTEGDLTGSVLDCRAGMSSLVAELSALGVPAVAVDPAYERPPDEMVTTVAEWLRDGEVTKRDNARYTWDWYGWPQRHNRLRENAAASFLEDFHQHPERYVAASLPDLPFPDRSFDLVLCARHLFARADVHDAGWHLAALREMVRVARREVRVFPLVVQSTGAPVPFLDQVRDALAADGHKTRVRQVPFEFQRGGNTMLTIAV